MNQWSKIGNVQYDAVYDLGACVASFLWHMNAWLPAFSTLIQMLYKTEVIAAHPWHHSPVETRQFGVIVRDFLFDNPAETQWKKRHVLLIRIAFE